MSVEARLKPGKAGGYRGLSKADKREHCWGTVRQRKRKPVRHRMGWDPIPAASDRRGAIPPHPATLPGRSLPGPYLYNLTGTTSPVQPPLYSLTYTISPPNTHTHTHTASLTIRGPAAGHSVPCASGMPEDMLRGVEFHAPPRACWMRG
eukprot:349584-Chlamydomonas_euryale.AAC.1